ncbi:MAG: DUF1549 and DUF1553 domain-containing protein [Verrucomicrobiota bacterium]|nr:DUF1549 and DUF1553 domain-containing protein [Verrucomicrobiota bacterium]
MLLLAVCSWEGVGLASEAHWAYQVPVRPKLPRLPKPHSVVNPVDQFILHHLAKRGIASSTLAKPERQARRVFLDLIGRPPQPSEAATFLVNPSQREYERMVDRLLASPQYGEKWARRWLDLARYADSNGFQADQLRDSWAYRDWVIDAFNNGMPFDRFTIEQLAGDLLPGATLSQRIATGFHRTPTCNVEAGVHPESNRVNQVVDRVNTTSTVFLGTTLECTQCHDHKHDPFTMNDYYRMFAFFNNTPLEVKQQGKGVTWNFYGPALTLPLTPEQQYNRVRLQEQIDDCEQEKEAAQFRERLKAIQPHTTLVMEERSHPRDTRLLLRGNYLTPGDAVAAGTPKVLHPFDSVLPPNRLGLARWLVDPANPLMARVTVNRWWAVFMGRGIVPTQEDFGTEGEPPTHRALLDWLAVEFVESGWSMKQMHRLIVTSRAYRQSSRVTASHLEVDSKNRHFSRAPRVRLSAEMIRDAALAASGLLSHRMHGPPVYPPQPDGIWRHVGRNAPRFVAATGENRFRRGVYVVWRRGAPYASFVNFDAPDRGACVVERPRTNTPLQALTLLNDAAYVEMALALAARLITEPGLVGDEERIDFAFRVVLSRLPEPAEVANLKQLLAKRGDELAANPKAVQQLIDGVKGWRVPPGVQSADLAKWFAVANVLLNLDEAITRG